MSIERINNVTTTNQLVHTAKPEKQSTSEVNNEISTSTKYMLGATALAGVIAIGIIGHKNNWWRKVAQEGQNLTNSTPSPHPQTPPASPHPQPNPAEIPIETTQSVNVENTHVSNISPVEKLIKKVNSTLSKELKHAKRALKQYNEIMDILLETEKKYGGDYIKYLKAKGFNIEIIDTEIIVKDKSGKIIQKLKNFNKDNKLRKPAHIDFYDNDGKLQKTVSFANKQNLPMIFFYDKKGQITKRITNIVAIGGRQKPQIFTTYLKNGRVVKEAVYIQPMEEGLNGDYSTSQVLNIAKYGRRKIFETGKIATGSAKKYVFIENEPYILKKDNTFEKCDIGNIFLNNRRVYTFNKKNQIIERKCISIEDKSNIYKAYDSLTGHEIVYISDRNNELEDYISYNPQTGKMTKRIFEDFDDEHKYMILSYDAYGKCIKDKTIKEPKSTFNTDELYETFKADYAPEEIMEINRW